MAFIDYIKEEDKQEYEDFEEAVFSLLDSLDYDSLSSKQQDLIDTILELGEDEEDDLDENLDEKKYSRVVRGGKRKKKLKCKEGYKAKGGRCVRMTSSEKRVRAKAAKRGARKRRGKESSISKKRKRSIRKRT